MSPEFVRRSVEILLLALLVGCSVWISVIAAWCVPY